MRQRHRTRSVIDAPHVDQIGEVDVSRGVGNDAPRWMGESGKSEDEEKRDELAHGDHFGAGKQLPFSRMATATTIRTLVLVEGDSDAAAVRTLADRIGCDLGLHHIRISSAAGVTNFSRVLAD